MKWKSLYLGLIASAFLFTPKAQATDIASQLRCQAMLTQIQRLQQQYNNLIGGWADAAQLPQAVLEQLRAMRDELTAMNDTYDENGCGNNGDDYSQQDPDEATDFGGETAPANEPAPDIMPAPEWAPNAYCVLAKSAETIGQVWDFCRTVASTGLNRPEFRFNPTYFALCLSSFRYSCPYNQCAPGETCPHS